MLKGASRISTMTDAYMNAGFKIPERYRISQERRQKLLDFLHINPGASLSEITGKLTADSMRVKRMLVDMAESGEVRREGKRGAMKLYPLTHTTADASSKYQAVRSAAEKSVRSRVKPPVSSPGRIIHTAGSLPIPRQDGQGSRHVHGRRINQE